MYSVQTFYIYKILFIGIFLYKNEYLFGYDSKILSTNTLENISVFNMTFFSAGKNPVEPQQYFIISDI